MTWVLGGVVIIVLLNSQNAIFCFTWNNVVTKCTKAGKGRRGLERGGTGGGSIGIVILSAELE